jgi:hypothetical protein
MEVALHTTHVAYFADALNHLVDLRLACQLPVKIDHTANHEDVQMLA